MKKENPMNNEYAKAIQNLNGRAKYRVLLLNLKCLQLIYAEKSKLKLKSKKNTYWDEGTQVVIFACSCLFIFPLWA